MIIFFMVLVSKYTGTTDQMSLFSRAKLLRLEIETEIGFEKFHELYKKLLEEGQWLNPESATVFENHPEIAQKFRELLVAECAYNAE